MKTKTQIRIDKKKSGTSTVSFRQGQEKRCSPSVMTPYERVAQLQSVIGNQAVGRLLDTGFLQAPHRIRNAPTHPQPRSNTKGAVTGHGLLQRNPGTPDREPTLSDVEAAERASSKRVVSPKKSTPVPDLSNWPDTLPKAVRNIRTGLKRRGPMFRRYAILFPWVKNRKPKALLRNYQAKQMSAKKASAIVARIAANRAAISERELGKPVVRYRYGYMYKGKTIAAPLATKKSRIAKIVWDELKSEGGLSSINTYDNMIFTWGRGFGGWGESRTGRRGTEGNLGKVMQHLFKRDPAAKKRLWNAGVAYTTYETATQEYWVNPYAPQKGQGRTAKPTWLVVDTVNNWVETGENALKLLAVSRQLLRLFVQLGEDKPHAQHVAAAQWDVIAKDAGAVPRAAYRWDPRAIALVAHLVHWFPGINRWPGFVHTGGNFVLIVRKFIKNAIKRFTRRLRNGARLLCVIRPITHLRAFARGVGFQALRRMAPKGLERFKRSVLASDSSRKGHTLVTDSNCNAQTVRFYDIGKPV